MSGATPIVVVEPSETSDGEVHSLSLRYAINDQHGVQILKYLDAMRQDRQLCDVILMVEGRQLFAHRALLSCHSNYFLEFFLENEQNHSTSKQIHHQMEHFEYVPLKLILQFIYRGSFHLPKDLVSKIYLTAYRLRVDSIFKACSNYLSDTLTEENCLSTRLLAMDDDLREKATECIRNRFSAVLQAREFHLLSSIKFELIDSTTIKTKSMFDLVLNWISDQTKPNKRILRELCDCTHWLYLKGDKLHDCVVMEDTNVLYSDLIRDYQSAHLAKRHLSTAVSTSPQKENFIIELATFPFYNDHLLSSLTPAETKFLHTSSANDHNYIGIALVHGKMLSISIHISSTPSLPTAPDLSSVSSEDKSSDESSSNPSLEKEWPIASLSTARCGFGTVSTNDRIYVIGGYNRGDCLNSIEEFDPHRGHWTLFSSSLTNRRGRVGASLVENRIVVCGGSNGQKELNTGEYFDLSTMNKWSAIKELPVAVVHCAICSDEQFVYLIGGIEGDKCKNECYRYDPRVNRWNSLPPMHQERNQAAVVYYQEKIYVFGGSSLTRCLSSCEIFNLSTNQWNNGPSMKENRRGCGAVLFGEKIFVIGGSNGVASLTSVEIYNPKTNEWLTNVNSVSPRLNVPRIGLGVAVCADRLYAIGGFDGRNFLKSIEVYDENTQQWFLNRFNLQSIKEMKPTQ